MVLLPSPFDFEETITDMSTDRWSNKDHVSFSGHYKQETSGTERRMSLLQALKFVEHGTHVGFHSHPSRSELWESSTDQLLPSLRGLTLPSQESTVLPSDENSPDPSFERAAQRHVSGFSLIAGTRKKVPTQPVSILKKRLPSTLPTLQEAVSGGGALQNPTGTSATLDELSLRNVRSHEVDDPSVKSNNSTKATKK
jgi:hypothetical protein